MAKSGVKFGKDAKDKFDSMKTNKTFNYLIFGFDKDYKEIEVISEGDKNATYQQFQQEMIDAAENKRQGRYAVYDFKDEDDPSSRKLGKLVFLTWTHDNCIPVKEKMLYASTKETVKSNLEGIHFDLQFTENDDFNYDSLRDLVLSKKK